MFMLRNTQRASKRGYAVAASAGSLEAGHEPARTMVLRWDGDVLDRGIDLIERDGKKISVPRYASGTATIASRAKWRHPRC